MYEEVFEGNVVNVMQQEIKTGLESTIFNEPGSHKFSNQLGHQINSAEFDGDWLAEKACLGFISTLNDAVVRYCQYIGFPSTEQYDPTRLEYDRKSWINTFKKNSYAHIHSHSTADISGVYYYQTTGKDGNLFFETPVTETGCSKFWMDHSLTFNIAPEKGLILLFPGWLSHGVRTNTTDSQRISLSFNINYKIHETNTRTN